jgi:2-keto-4-pentenoate hydratase/2-oxohepta-3-ene-1,7-dioic acid hydratase in catechol pathway
MRVVSYDAGRGPRAGVLREDAIVDAWAGLGREPDHDPSVRALLREGLLGELHVLEGAESIPLAEARLLPPVPDPGKVIGIGLNYGSHAEETGRAPPEHPTFFAKFATCLCGPGDEVPLPSFSDKVDYEAEVAFVVGRRCKDVLEPDALDVIAGYTLLNDLSARDYQALTPQWMPGKTFDGSAPWGPALVTPDEAGPPDSIEFELTLNCKRMQKASTADLIHSIPALVEFLSRLMTLEPGDIVSTGTPAGVGSARYPRVWLKPGDEIVISSPTLGRLETRLS